MYTGWSSMWTRAGRPTSCTQPNIFSSRQQKDITRQPPVRLCRKRKTWCPPWWGLLHDVHLGEDCYRMSTLVRIVTGLNCSLDCWRMLQVSTLIRNDTGCLLWWGLLQDISLMDSIHIVSSCRPILIKSDWVSVTVFSVIQMTEIKS